MPPVSSWMIRASLGWLFVGSVAQSVVAASELGARPLRLAVLHFWFTGFLCQLIFGTAHWLFPRPREWSVDRSERLMWATFALLNTGTSVRALHGVAAGGPSTGAFAASAAVLLALGVLTGAASIWPRTRVR